MSTMQLFIEPELRTNQPKKKLLHPERPEERIYESDGVGMTLKKGDEVRMTLLVSFQNMNIIELPL